MTIWTAVFERTATGWSAYVPALPGLAVTGSSRDEVEELLRQGIPFHLEGLAEEGQPAPDPRTIEVCNIAI